nr:MAG TPA: hypothetical protein [Caudoviricetes sp.]
MTRAGNSARQGRGLHHDRNDYICLYSHFHKSAAGFDSPPCHSHLYLRLLPTRESRRSHTAAERTLVRWDREFYGDYLPRWFESTRGHSVFSRKLGTFCPKGGTFRRKCPH